MARNNNTRMFLSVRKNMRMDETCLSLTKILPLDKREGYIHTFLYYQMPSRVLDFPRQ